MFEHCEEQESPLMNKKGLVRPQLGRKIGARRGPALEKWSYIFLVDYYLEFDIVSTEKKD